MLDPLRQSAALLLLTLCALASSARAQGPPPSDETPLEGQDQKLEALEASANAQVQQLEELKKRLQDQESRIAARDSLVAEQRTQIGELQSVVKRHQDRLVEADSLATERQHRLDSLNELLLDLTNRLRALEDTAPIDSLSQFFEERMNQLEASLEEIPEVPPDVVSAGDFPGSFQIPGTGAALKIGGRVRMSWVTTLDALGSEDRFICAAIPVEGTVDAEKGARVDLSASTSWFNFDLRTPTGVGQMRAFLEGDFAGPLDGYRLRHAYGQYRRIIAGQTWSTLVDLKASPEELDFEGLNARIQFRQTLVRWFDRVREDLDFAISIEDAQPDLTGADGISHIPDMIGRIVWSREDSHFHTGVVMRQLRAEPEPGTSVSAVGWGISLSTRIGVPVLAEGDDLILALNAGKGIGRYITDLRAEGGQDAVYDSTAFKLEPLRAISAYGAVRHHWTEGVHSTIIYGFVRVRNLDAQPDDAYRRTVRVTANLIYSPISRLDLGLEVIYGTRRNKDGADGRARQIQVAGTFLF